MATKQIKKNQVVWAKLKGYPWWPSCISQVGTTDVVVNFLGENTHATIKLDQVHDFKENYSLYIKNVNDRNKKLKQAVAIGLRISEGKTSYEEESKKMEKKYQMEEDEEITNQTSSESSGKVKKIKKGAQSSKKPTNTVPTPVVTSVPASGSRTPKKGSARSGSKVSIKGAIESESKNSGQVNDKIVPENAGEPSIAASEKDVPSTNTRSSGNKKQSKVNDKQSRKSQQLANKYSVSSTINHELGVEELIDTEPSNFNSNPIHDKDMNSADQLASYNQKADNSEKSPTHQHHSHHNEGEQNEFEEEGEEVEHQQEELEQEQDQELVQHQDLEEQEQEQQFKPEEEEEQQQHQEEEMNLEKVTKKSANSANGSPQNGFADDKKENFTSSINNQYVNTSDSNLQSQNGQSNTKESKNTQNSNKRNKRSALTKNGSSSLNVQTQSADINNSNEIVDSPRKKIKGNNQKPYYPNPQDALEVQINIESILSAFQYQKNSNIFKLNEMKELDRMCDTYFTLNISALNFIQTSLGKVFLQSLNYVQQFKHNEEYNPEIKQKLEVVVENIRDKVLLETLGSDMKELMLKKKVQTNGNGNQQNEVDQEEKGIHSSTQLGKVNTNHTKLNGDVVAGQEKEPEDPKKLRDQQLRKKICKKINELLKENYGLEKAQAQDLCVQIERKIKSVQAELNHDYKNNVKGLIRLLKAKEISIDKLRSCNVEELIEVIQHENIQADLKTQGIQFEKNSSMVDNSD